MNLDCWERLHSVLWGPLAQICWSLGLASLRKDERNFSRHRDQQSSFLHPLASLSQRVACKEWSVLVGPCSCKWKLEDYPWLKVPWGTLRGTGESTNIHFWLCIRWSWQLESSFQMKEEQVPLLLFELCKAAPHQEPHRFATVHSL